MPPGLALGSKAISPPLCVAERLRQAQQLAEGCLGIGGLERRRMRRVGAPLQQDGVKDRDRPSGVEVHGGGPVVAAVQGVEAAEAGGPGAGEVGMERKALEAGLGGAAQIERGEVAQVEVLRAHVAGLQAVEAGRAGR